MAINKKEIEKTGNGAEKINEDEIERVFKSAMKDAFMKSIADCTFYLFPLHIDANVIFGRDERAEICNHFADQI